MNSGEQEDRSDDAISWEGRLEDMDRPQHNPAHDVSVKRSNRSSEEAGVASINPPRGHEETAVQTEGDRGIQE